MSRFQFFFYFGLALFAIAIIFGIAYGFQQNATDLWNTDSWACGYVNITAMNLSEIRDCFRD